MSTGTSDKSSEGSTEQVVSHVRSLIERGELRPGDRLPAERDLAVQIGVSRPTVRAGLRALAAMGVVKSRHGSGTYIPDGPPTLGSEPLSFLAALHGFTREEMYEARRILEVGAAGLAAERASSEQVATMAEEVASLFASMDDPQGFLRHDIEFHRAVATASGNPIVATLVEMVSALYYERRRQTAGAPPTGTCTTRPKRTGAIYQAVRSRDPNAARDAMNDHLMQASAYQERKRSKRSGARPCRGSPAPTTPASRPRRPARERRARVVRREPAAGLESPIHASTHQDRARHRRRFPRRDRAGRVGHGPDASGLRLAVLAKPDARHLLDEFEGEVTPHEGQWLLLARRSRRRTRPRCAGTCRG